MSLVWLAALALGSLLVAGCSITIETAGTDTSTTTTLQAAVSACNHPQDADADRRCLQQIEEFLESRTHAWADGGAVTHAAFEMALYQLDLDSLGPAIGTNFQFSRDTEVLDGDAEEAATTPIETTWTVGGSKVHLWTCFDGNSVTVSADACSGP
jgi:outer membrane murein-binding lipoprotein Lpp